MIENKIKMQLAHVFAAHGADPEQFMYKLECLVLEWYQKGIESGRGIKLLCPHCKFEVTVYHMEWTAIICPNLKCGKQINQIGKGFDYRINYPDAS